jgi:hypothetical protein
VVSTAWPICLRHNITGGDRKYLRGGCGPGPREPIARNHEGYFVSEKVTFPPSLFTKVRFSSLNSKTGQTTSLNFSNRTFYLTGAVLKAVLLQWRRYATVQVVLSFFLFISVKSLKNHNKSQKNHKMENPILLHSTWVDLHSEHIIWYALVQSFCYEGFAFFFFIYFGWIFEKS